MIASASHTSQGAANAKDVDEDMIFAIVHTFEMLKTLKVDYYAAYHGEKPLEP